MRPNESINKDSNNKADVCDCKNSSQTKKYRVGDVIKANFPSLYFKILQKNFPEGNKYFSI